MSNSVFGAAAQSSRSPVSFNMCAFIFVALAARGALAQSGQPAGVQTLEQRVADMQIRYEGRIAALEAQVLHLRAAPTALPVADDAIEQALGGVMLSGVMGRLDQTTRFSNRFNPAISLVSDLVYSYSSRGDSFETDNQFRMRPIELGFAGRIDPHVNLIAALAADEDGMTLEEGYAVWDKGLPDTFTLRAGRLPIDFGKLSAMHDHELSFVDKPSTLQEYLGGKALTTGLAVHHWFGVGEVPVRWSVGVGNSLGQDAHAIQGPAAGEQHHGAAATGAEPFGRRGADDFVWTARVTSSIDLGANDDLQLGSSGIFVPGAKEFFYTDPPANTTVASGALGRSIIGIDAHWRHADAGSTGAFTLGGEWIWVRMELADTSAPVPVFSGARNHSQGGWLFAEYAFDEHWSVGARAERFQHAEDSSLVWRGWNCALTWNIDEFNRVRFELGGVDTDDAVAPYGFAMLQWTLVLGSHAHALAW